MEKQISFSLLEIRQTKNPRHVELQNPNSRIQIGDRLIASIPQRVRIEQPPPNWLYGTLLRFLKKNEGKKIKIKSKTHYSYKCIYNQQIRSPHVSHVIECETKPNNPYITSFFKTLLLNIEEAKMKISIFHLTPSSIPENGGP